MQYMQLTGSSNSSRLSFLNAEKKVKHSKWYGCMIIAGTVITYFQAPKLIDAFNTQVTTISSNLPKPLASTIGGFGRMLNVGSHTKLIMGSFFLTKIFSSFVLNFIYGQVENRLLQKLKSMNMNEQHAKCLTEIALFVLFPEIYLYYKIEAAVGLIIDQIDQIQLTKERREMSLLQRVSFLA